MLNNIKLIGIIFLSVLLLTNCKKENKDTQQPGEIVFSAIDVNDTQKDGIDQFDVLCNEELVVTKARVNLNGILYYPATFMSEGKLLTQSIKLPPGDYKILEFTLLTADDVIVKSTPMAGSDFAGYVNNPIDDVVDFTVASFVKNQKEVDVLCYLEAYYESFGFEWFDVTEITIREQCFFGDFCIKDVNQYTNSLYDDDGVLIDEKAIFEIRLNKYDASLDEYVWYATFNNYENGVYTSPLCVEYADYDATVDLYQAELWIYVTSGTSWGYEYFHTWDFKDAEDIEQLYGVGDDGVVDFVLGNCAADTPDLLLPPWMNLPTNVQYTLSSGGLSGLSYWDINITGLGGFGVSPYDLWDGDYLGWCADQGTGISSGLHSMNAFSSLYPDKIPNGWATPGRKNAICAANWLWNHLGNINNDVGLLTYNGTAVTGEMVQNALWNLFNGIPAMGISATMASDALGHCDYSPLPGGWAAIFFVPTTNANVQMTFFVVDP